jgi:hypothetical protein
MRLFFFFWWDWGLNLRPCAGKTGFLPLAGTTPPVPFALVILEMGVSQIICQGIGFKL